MYYALRYGRATSPLWALRRPYCPTEVEARWWYSFSKTIQNVPSVGSGIDADRTGKRKLNFNGVLQDQWGSAEMATGVLRVWVFLHQTNSTPVLGCEEHVCVVVCVFYMCGLVLVC